MRIAFRFNSPRLQLIEQKALRRTRRRAFLFQRWGFCRRFDSTSDRPSGEKFDFAGRQFIVGTDDFQFAFSHIFGEDWAQ